MDLKKKHKLPLEDVFVVLPAKDESKRIEPVLVKLQLLGYKNIVVVNDGSTDNTREVVSKFKHVKLLDHVINLGPGASTLTGIKYAVRNGAEYVVTMDADNQHNPENVTNLIKKMRKDELDLVIGTRFKQKNKIPATRIAFNFVGNIISYVITGIYVSDSQSGMKALSRKFGEQIELNFDGFEFCIEIIKQAQINKAKVGEVPIDVIYTKDTMSKGQNFFTGVNMLVKLFNPFS